MIDLTTNEVRINPYPLYNRMREESPICKVKVPMASDTGNTYMLSRYEDVKEWIQKYTILTSADTPEIFSPNWLSNECQSDFYMLTEEPPEYHIRRSAIAQPFATKPVYALSEEIESIADDVVSQIMEKRAFDYVGEFAYPFIGGVMSKLTGLDELQETNDIHEWMRIVEHIPFIKNPDRETIAEIETVILKQKSNMRRIVDDRRKQPRNDFVSRLVFSKLKGIPLSCDQLINIIELVIRSGFQTTVHLLSIAVIQLVRRQDITEQLKKDSALTPRFVDELLRLYSSLVFAGRNATQDVSIHGVNIEKGARVLLNLAAANRDPRIFTNPDEYDFTRSNKKDNLGFGYGPHICLGMHLARLEVEVVVSKLLQLVSHFSCPHDNQIEWNISPQLRGAHKLPITQH